MLPQQLSKADTKVLAQVFDPESAAAKAEVIVDPDLPADPQIQNEQLLGELRRRERETIAIIEQFEKSGRPDSAKDDAYRSAIAILDTVVAEFPDYASARNNRAQVRRWRFGDRNTLCQSASQTWSDRAAAGLDIVQDLETSIALASPPSPQDAVSPAQGRLLAQAHTQLGAIFYAAFKDLDSEEDMVPSQLKGTTWCKDRFEEEASRMFYLGGLYGNEVAKALAVHTNPHAKLCGSIVKEAMRKELAAAQ